jgi:tripartite-type tricarboxylate transporter receptor subunit TctC
MPVNRSPVLLSSLALILVSSLCCAQSPSSRPVRWVLGFAPGGAPDNIARVVAQQLTAEIAQPVVLDNRPGANGIIGADVVAKATPDGHTLLVTPAAFAINASVYRNLPFDPIKSFAPVTNLCLSPGLLLVVNASFPAKTVQQLIDMAKQPGSRLAYGTSGIGNVTHLAGALFNARAGTNLAHVPYKGGSLATTALLSNEIQMMFTNPATILPQVKAGRVRVIAYNGPARVSFLPDVPTMAESGVSGMELDPSWYGLFAPTATPAAIVSRLHREVRTALANSGLRQRLAELGVEPDGRTPTEFKQFVEHAIRHSAELVRLAGITPQ